MMMERSRKCLFAQWDGHVGPRAEILILQDTLIINRDYAIMNLQKKHLL
ncbi:MAG: hypothetical protein KJ846_03630 [Proteobacteria bacterium]|nr:hypothetical protein [Pseudomonadota bacterium]